MAKYRFARPEKDDTPMTNLLVFGYECGDGWFNLVNSMFAELKDVKKPKEFKIIQLKEKYAELRVYYVAGNNDIDEIISDYSAISRHTCELCGKPGRIKEIRGWFTTCCKECEIKIKKDRVRK